MWITTGLGNCIISNRLLYVNNATIDRRRRRRQQPRRFAAWLLLGAICVSQLGVCEAQKEGNDFADSKKGAAASNPSQNPNKHSDDGPQQSSSNHQAAVGNVRATVRNNQQQQQQNIGGGGDAGGADNSDATSGNPSNPNGSPIRPVAGNTAGNSGENEPGSQQQQGQQGQAQPQPQSPIQGQGQDHQRPDQSSSRQRPIQAAANSAPGRSGGGGTGTSTSTSEGALPPGLVPSGSSKPSGGAEQVPPDVPRQGGGGGANTNIQQPRKRPQNNNNNGNIPQGSNNGQGSASDGSSALAQPGGGSSTAGGDSGDGNAGAGGIGTGTGGRGGGRVNSGGQQEGGDLQQNSRPGGTKNVAAAGGSRPIPDGSTQQLTPRSGPSSAPLTPQEPNAEATTNGGPPAAGQGGEEDGGGGASSGLIRAVNDEYGDVVKNLTDAGVLTESDYESKPVSDLFAILLEKLINTSPGANEDEQRRLVHQAGLEFVEVFKANAPVAKNASEMIRLVNEQLQGAPGVLNEGHAAGAAATDSGSRGGLGGGATDSGNPVRFGSPSSGGASPSNGGVTTFGSSNTTYISSNQSQAGSLNNNNGRPIGANSNGSADGQNIVPVIVSPPGPPGVTDSGIEQSVELSTPRANGRPPPRVGQPSKGGNPLYTTTPSASGGLAPPQFGGESPSFVQENSSGGSNSTSPSLENGTVSQGTGSEASGGGASETTEAGGIVVPPVPDRRYPFPASLPSTLRPPLRFFTTTSTSTSAAVSSAVDIGRHPQQHGGFPPVVVSTTQGPVIGVGSPPGFSPANGSSIEGEPSPDGKVVIGASPVDGTNDSLSSATAGGGRGGGGGGDFPSPPTWDVTDSTGGGAAGSPAEGSGLVVGENGNNSSNNGGGGIVEAVPELVTVRPLEAGGDGGSGVFGSGLSSNYTGTTDIFGEGGGGFAQTQSPPLFPVGGPSSTPGEFPAPFTHDVNEPFGGGASGDGGIQPPLFGGTNYSSNIGATTDNTNFNEANSTIAASNANTSSSSGGDVLIFGNDFAHTPGLFGEENATATTTTAPAFITESLNETSVTIVPGSVSEAGLPFDIGAPTTTVGNVTTNGTYTATNLTEPSSFIPAGGDLGAAGVIPETTTISNQPINETGPVIGNVSNPNVESGPIGAGGLEISTTTPGIGGPTSEVAITESNVNETGGGVEGSSVVTEGVGEQRPPPLLGETTTANTPTSGGGNLTQPSAGGPPGAEETTTAAGGAGSLQPIITTTGGASSNAAVIVWSFRIPDMSWDPELLNKESETYQQLHNDLILDLQTLFKTLEPKRFLDVTIKRFSKGSVIVDGQTELVERVDSGVMLENFVKLVSDHKNMIGGKVVDPGSITFDKRQYAPQSGATSTAGGGAGPQNWIIAVVVAGVLLVLIIIAAVVVIKRKKRQTGRDNYMVDEETMNGGAAKGWPAGHGGARPPQTPGIAGPNRAGGGGGGVGRNGGGGGDQFHHGVNMYEMKEPSAPNAHHNYGYQPDRAANGIGANGRSVTEIHVNAETNVDNEASSKH